MRAENFSPTTVLLNNGMYGTIRMHHMRECLTNVHGTELRNPDFVARWRRRMATRECAFARTQKFQPALVAGLDPAVITTLATLSVIREA